MWRRRRGGLIASLAADYDLRRAYDLGSIIPHRIVDKPDIAVGARGDTLGNSFLGQIGEVEVFNRALSDDEVKGVYDSQK